MGIQERANWLERQARYKTRPRWYKKWWGILILIILFLFLILLVGSGIYVWQQAKEISANNFYFQKTAEQKTQKELVEGFGENWLGTSTPKLTIVEFSDFACPYSRESAPIVREAALMYGQNIKIIFRDFLGHENSMDLANAARCAGAQNKFWEMHDLLFSKQDQITVADLPSLAKDLGLDVDRFNQCLQAKTYDPIITQDYYDAARLGVAGTPTWFINSYKAQGAINRADFLKLIAEVLNSAPAKGAVIPAKAGN